MTRARNAALILLCVFLTAASAWAQSKGNARINGKILDDQGKPAPGVVVRALKAGDQTAMEATTNDKGEWTIERLPAGQWNFEFLKDGFEPQRMALEVTDKKNAPVDMKLTKAARPSIRTPSSRASMQKAVALQKGGDQPGARKLIEDIIAKYPEAYRLNAFVASTYEGEKNYDKAIEHQKIVVEKEPNDFDMKSYIAELYTLKGDKVEAQKILDSIDMTQVKDPTLFINSAITAINAGRADEAIATLDKVQNSSRRRPTSTTIARAPTSPRRRCRKPRRTSKNSSRWRHLMRASCRMRSSFSKSSKTSSNLLAVVACAVALATAACGGSGDGPNRHPHHRAAAGGTGRLHRHRRRSRHNRTRSPIPVPCRSGSPAERPSAATAILADVCTTRCGRTRPAPDATSRRARSHRHQCHRHR